MTPEVSIVMRSHNDIDCIEDTLEMIFKQKFTDFELLNVDSGSKDGTFEVIKKYNPDNSYQIKPASYIPGRVLNEAVKKCAGRIIVFNNSDCLPCSPDWLGNLIKPIQRGEAEAVYGKQLPRKDAQPLVRKDNLRAFSSIGQSWFHFFSLATSAILKEELMTQPFSDNLQYSEDIDWSYKAKQRGRKIVFAEDAVVRHSHNYTIPELKRRFYGEGFAEGEIYGSRGKRDKFLLKVAKPLIAETIRDILYLVPRGELRSILYAPLYRWHQKYWTYRGLQDYFKNNTA